MLCGYCGEIHAGGDCDYEAEHEECQFCGETMCDGSGYNCYEEDYNIRDDTWEAVP